MSSESPDSAHGRGRRGWPLGRAPPRRRRAHRHRRHADPARPAAGGGLCRHGAAERRRASRSCRSPAGRPAGAITSPGCGRWTAWSARTAPSGSATTPAHAAWSAASWSTMRPAGPTARGWTRWPRRILAEVPGCALASDQLYREADLAIDFCEDVAPLARRRGRPHRRPVRGGRLHRQGQLDPRQRLVRPLRQAHHDPAVPARGVGHRPRRRPAPLRLRRRFAQRPADVRLLPGQRRRRQPAPLPAGADQPAALADHGRGRPGLCRARPAAARHEGLQATLPATLVQVANRLDACT